VVWYGEVISWYVVSYFLFLNYFELVGGLMFGVYDDCLLLVYFLSGFLVFG